MTGLVLALASLTCERRSSTGPLAPSADQEQGIEEGTSSLEDEVNRRWEEALDRIGQACNHDSDCFAPLRCDDTGRCVEPPAMTGEGGPRSPSVLCYGHQREVLYQVELAIDSAQRSRGLMYRPWMREGWGMLFIYPDLQEELSFWMANTYIPLDMVFLDGEAVITGVVENARPLDRTGVGVHRPSQYVLELNAGEAPDAGLEASVRCEFLNMPAGVFHPGETQL